MNKKINLFAVLSIISCSLYATPVKFFESKVHTAAFIQVREVKGQVKDEKGIPLAQAVVWIKGSDLYVQTNEKGEFKIKLPTEFESLTVELDGYVKQELRITGFENMAIVLKKSKETNSNSTLKQKATTKSVATQEVDTKKYHKTPKIYKPSAPVDIQEASVIKSHYDVCIYGATSAGVIAAYTVAKQGKSVLLIGANTHIGGLSAGGLGQTDIGNKHVIKGVSRDFYRRLGNVYGSLESWQFEPKEASNVFKQYIKEANIAFVLDYNIQEVVKSDRVISKIKISKNDKTRTATVSAKRFIDASYEGDLMASAGVSYTVGREASNTYGETYNGVYMSKYRMESSGYHQFPDNISPYKNPKDPKSGLIFGVQDAVLKPNGTGDKTVQAYNFRITLTDSVENQIPITRPKDYDSTKYELLVRLFAAQPTLREINDYFIWSKMPNRKTDINNRGGFSTDYIGANHNYPNATPDDRKKIFDDHLAYTKGLLYFYATDKRVPKELSDYVRKWGYPKDEFTAFENFTPQLYVRESRRMLGDYIMTAKHCLGDEVVNDGIAYAAYTMDSHNTQRLVVDGMVKNEGNVEIGGFAPYPISYRSLLPKRTEITNLSVPVCMSASHIAYGSIRMEPVFMLLGQIAGLASTLSIENDVNLHELDYRAINKLMEEDPYIQNGFKDIVIDTKNLPAVNTSEWTKKQHKIYFSNELAVSNNSKKLDISIDHVKPGKYKVYYFVPVVSEIYSNPYYTFTLDSVTLHTDMMEHLNEWLLLGEIELNEKSSSKLSVENASHTVFNAVQLVPVID